MHRNEPDAFEGLYNVCAGYVSFVCTKFCNSKEDAEEAVQDTFVIAFKKADQLRSDSLLGYLRKIAVRECYRKRKAHDRQITGGYVTDEVPDDLPELDNALIPESALMDKERQQQLLVEISKLPRAQREMVYLYYYMGFDAAQIAELMECSTSVVYMTLSRARKAIKRKLEEDRLPVAAKALVLLPLAALFLAEETTYLAAYVPVAPATMTAIVATSAASTVGTGSIVGYITAACAVLVLGTAITLYVNWQPEPETEWMQPPAITQLAPQTTSAITNLPGQIIPIDENTAVHTTTPTDTTAPMQAPATPAPTEAALQPTAPQQTTQSEAVPPQTTPMQTTPPLTTPAPTEPSPQATTAPLPSVDRTQDVLAALAQAHTQVQVNHILAYFGFAFDTDIITPAEMHLIFHLFNEGSGDILVGMATSTNDSAWRMRYTYFEGSTAQKDSVDLYIWMREE